MKSISPPHCRKALELIRHMRCGRSPDRAIRDDRRSPIWFRNMLFFVRTIGLTFPIALLHGVLAVFPAHADTVWMNGDSAPIHGRIVQITTDSIVFESVERPGTTETILRSAIRTWHRPIDSDRLESLHPESPGKYLDYAEELAGIRFDPASMELSRQLAIMALHLELKKRDARHASSTVAVRSLALLLEITDDEGQKQKLVRLGVANGLANPPHDSSPDGNGSGQEASVPDRGTAGFLLEQLRSIRRREFQSADNEQAMNQLANALTDWQFLLTANELQNCVSATNLSTAQLLRLVRLENAIAEFLESGRKPEFDQGWETTARLPAIPVPEAISARNATEFDPEKCLWRDGQWVKDER